MITVAEVEMATRDWNAPTAESPKGMAHVLRLPGWSATDRKLILVASFALLSFWT